MVGTGLGDVFGRSFVRGLSLRFVQNIQGGLSLGARHSRWGNPSGSYLALFIFAVHRHNAKRPIRSVI